MRPSHHLSGRIRLRDEERERNAHVTSLVDAVSKLLQLEHTRIIGTIARDELSSSTLLVNERLDPTARVRQEPAVRVSSKLRDYKHICPTLEHVARSRSSGV